MPEVPQDVLDQVDRALTRTVTTALTISPLLDDPYPDDPRWTPYTRWVKPNADRVMAARDALRAATSTTRAQGEEDARHG